MQAEGTLGDTSSLAVALDVNSATALVGTGALLTEFMVTPVPEPRSAALFFSGMAFLSVVVWRARLRNGSRSLEQTEGKDL